VVNHPLCGLLSSFLEGVSPGKHPLVQDARDPNALAIGSVEDDMPSVLHASQAGTNVVANSARLRVVGERLATTLEIGNVADRLVYAPRS
jgi:hypothetical protein